MQAVRIFFLPDTFATCARLSELAILVTARQCNQQVEGAIHAPIRAQVGIPAALFGEHGVVDLMGD
jgi:hypothetical protein